jgi:hypothetical protein
VQIDAIIWDLDDDPDGNVQHCADHGVNKDEVEEVFENAIDADISRTSGRPVGLLSSAKRTRAGI